MPAYVIFIGCMNTLGALLLVGAMSDDFADGLLRRWTKIIPDDKPFRHSEYGRVWLWWAAIGTGFYGVINLVASTWPAPYIRAIAWGNVYAYFSFEALAIAATLNRKRWGSGIYLTHFLWIGQGGWGLYTLLRS